MRTLLIIPAFNEAACIGGVIGAVRQHFSGDIAVIDDGSEDDTRQVAHDAGAVVLRHACNLGIGAAVQTGFLYALREGYDLVVRQDGDGQHDPAQIPRLLEVLERDEADIVVGSRFAGDSDYRSSAPRRIGIRILAWVVSRIARQKVTDPTSGFQALDRKAIRLFAADYPHDYPEVEATVMCFRHRLRLAEVPVRMRERSSGSSSITALQSIYYMLKVLLAIFVGVFRRNVVLVEER